MGGRSDSSLDIDEVIDLSKLNDKDLIAIGRQHILECTPHKHTPYRCLPLLSPSLSADSTDSPPLTPIPSPLFVEATEILTPSPKRTGTRCAGAAGIRSTSKHSDHE